MVSAKDVIQQQAADALEALDIQDPSLAAEAAESILRQTVYWEKLLPGGERLLFVRFYSLVVMREEVFLGNVLLNDFLAKSFVRSVTQIDGQAAPIANDLENYYFLVRTSYELPQLAASFRAEVEHSLPEMFFGEPDPSRGIYGSFETMLDFNKANVEPFPVFIMPHSYRTRLEKAVRESLLNKIKKSQMDRNPTSIMANLAFFYCHDGSEMQSPSKFLFRLAYEYFPSYAAKLEEAFNVTTLTKDKIRTLLPTEITADPSNEKKLFQVLDYIDSVSSSPGRFGWLEIFFGKDKENKWSLDVRKPRDQRPVARLLDNLPRLSPEKIWEEVIKNSIVYRLSDIKACSTTTFRDLLGDLVTQLGNQIDSGDVEKWLMPYISDKFLQISEHDLAEQLLSTIQLGYIQFRPAIQPADITCRVCGIQLPAAGDKSILMGQNTHKFHNQSVKQRNEKDPKACLRCAICTYLMVKLLGSEAVGQPQVPKSYNLIFHYGKHSDAEVARLAQQMDRLWELVRQHREAATMHREVAEARKLLAQKAAEERNARKRAILEEELKKRQSELDRRWTDLAHVEEEIFADCPWMRDIGASPVPSENPALDIISNMPLSESKVERHILGMGTGGYRLTLFVLPQIHAPGEKERDFAQSRFSNSWITVTAFLSFLQNLCGCDGPFYYQSLPALTTDAFKPGIFYIHNRLISAQEAQSKYAAVYQLAWKLIWQRGTEGFVKKVLLAEKLLADPLATFSNVMRDSSILGQQRGNYKQLKSLYRSDWGAQDLTEYARFIQQLAEL